MRRFRSFKRVAGGYRRRTVGYKRRGRRFRGVYKMSRGGIRL